MLAQLIQLGTADRTHGARQAHGCLSCCAVRRAAQHAVHGVEVVAERRGHGPVVCTVGGGGCGVEARGWGEVFGVAGWGFEGGEARCEGHVEEGGLRELVHGVVGFEEEVGEVVPAGGRVKFLDISALAQPEREKPRNEG